MLISFKQKTSVAKVVQVYISKLNTEMIDRFRQLKRPCTETAGRHRNISGCHTKGYTCLMGEKNINSREHIFMTTGPEKIRLEK